MATTRNVLVTGGAGYIGSACAAALLQDGVQVTVLDDLSHGVAEKVPSGATFITGDVTDPRVLEDAFANGQFDAVLHFAAKKAVEESEANPTVYFHTNVGGVLNLLATMERHQVPALVFSSTAAVYDATAPIDRFTEDAPTIPVNVYGRTKLIAEMCIAEYVRTGKLARATVLRYFNVAGDAGLAYREPNARNVFPILARATREGTPFSIFGTDYKTKDGTCVRDYIHLADLADAHRLALAQGGSGTYNLGTAQGYSVRELVAAFERASGKKVQVVESPRRAGDPACLLSDARRAARELGWTPTRTLDEMVESTLSVYTN
jgi:UDP-glucose 4-epimerase